MNTLTALVSYIQGEAKPSKLEGHATLIRGVDIVARYKQLDDAVLLAYTNKRVEELNVQVQGYAEPKNGDRLFSPTSKHYYTFIEPVPAEFVYELDRPFGEPLTLENDKYKTISTLRELGLSFATVYDHELEEECTVAYWFGHETFRSRLAVLKHEAANANAAIEKSFKQKASQWSVANAGSRLARDRAKAWREFLAVNNNAMCLDFAHALTVHKSQGSTYKYVVADTDNIALAGRFDMAQYLKLLYVAMSRASVAVYTN